MRGIAQQVRVVVCIGFVGLSDSLLLSVTADVHGVIVSCNSAVQVLFGYEPAELVDCSCRSILQLLPRKIKKKSKTVMQVQAMRESGPQSDRFSKTDMWKDIMADLTSVRIVNGRCKDDTLIPLFLTSSAMNVGGVQLYALLFERIPKDSAILTTDHDGVIQSVTTNVVELVGISVQELIGTNVEAWFVRHPNAPDTRRASGFQEEDDDDDDEYSMLELSVRRNKYGLNAKHAKGDPLKLLAHTKKATIPVTLQVLDARHHMFVVSVKLTENDEPAETPEGQETPAEEVEKEIGYYTVKGKLGVGQCGAVRKGRHRTTEMTVAVKTLAKEKFEEIGLTWSTRELDLMRYLNHPNIVQLYDCVYGLDRMYLIMELMTGGELLSFCCQAGPLPEDTARKFFRDLVGAVDYLHRKGIVHRDLKLENCLLDQDKRVKIIDFGLANSTLRGMLKTSCVPDDHEVLTNRGFMALDAFVAAHAGDPGLLVAAYDAQTDELVYERPLRVAVLEEATRRLVEFVNEDASLSYQVTEDHDVYVAKRGKVRAAEYAEGREHEARHVAAARRGARGAKGRAEKSGQELEAYGRRLREERKMAEWVWERSGEEVRRIVKGLSEEEKENGGRGRIRTGTGRFQEEVVRALVMAGETGVERGEWVEYGEWARPEARRARGEIRTRERRGRVWCLTMPSGVFWVRRGAGWRAVVTGNCGSADYAAPELFACARYLGPPVDVWALGVMLFAMVCGVFPFEEVQSTLDGDYVFPPDLELTESLTQLIADIFVLNPDLRLTLEQIRRNHWVNQGFDHPPQRPAVSSTIQQDFDQVKRDVLTLRPDILVKMELKFGFAIEAVVESLLSEDINQFTATYKMLLTQYPGALKVTKADPDSLVYCDPQRHNAVNSVIKQAIARRERGAAIDLVKMRVNVKDRSKSDSQQDRPVAIDEIMRRRLDRSDGSNSGQPTTPTMTTSMPRLDLDKALSAPRRSAGSGSMGAAQTSRPGEPVSSVVGGGSDRDEAPSGSRSARRGGSGSSNPFRALIRGRRGSRSSRGDGGESDEGEGADEGPPEERKDGILGLWRSSKKK